MKKYLMKFMYEAGGLSLIVVNALSYKALIHLASENHLFLMATIVSSFLYLFGIKLIQREGRIN